MGETTIILENEAKKNEVQSPSENESSPLFSVDMLQVTQNAQNQNGFSNTNLQHNHIMLTNDSERGIHLELNRNYLKSFPARLKFCHVFLGSLSSGLLFYFTPDNYLKLTLMPIVIQSILTLCSLIFLITSTMIWKADGKMQMARINFVFHTVAIILLMLIICLLLIGVFSNSFQVITLILVSSFLNLLNVVSYHTSIQLVLATCENY